MKDRIGNTLNPKVSVEEFRAFKAHVVRSGAKLGVVTAAMIRDYLAKHKIKVTEPPSAKS